MKYRSAGKTDVGQSRGHNEDNMLVLPDKGLFAVCDGLGGHNAGEVASRIAVESIEEIVLKSPDVPEGFHDDASPQARLLAWAVSETSNRIHAQAQADPSKKGMGTTATVVWVHDGKANLAQVGDSRAYLFRKGKFTQITEDHSFVAEQVRTGVLTTEEARHSLYRNVITRALGIHEQVQVDVFELDVRGGDRLLLCSDGLTGVISDTELKMMIEAADNPEALCTSFIAEANARGGPDNITAVVIYILD